VGGLPATPVAAKGADPQTVVVFDGQIFNAAEAARPPAGGRPLAARQRSGRAVRPALRARGPAGFKRVDGQFGVALYDGRKNALVLARDPLGVRALYYTRTPAGSIVFASEIKGVLAAPDVVPELDPVRRFALPDLPHGAGPAHALQGHLQGAGRLDGHLRRERGRRTQAVLGPALGRHPRGRRRELLLDKVKQLHDEAVRAA
jgi:asparagine synthetase B (glutamine-hydrolysing)